MEIQQFLHIALNITDLAAAKHFYAEILGLPEADRPLNFPGVWYQIGNMQLHLIVSPTNAPSSNHERWGRNRHIAFAINDVEAMKQRLTQLGQSFQASGSGRPAIFVRDPDDNVVELGEV